MQSSCQESFFLNFERARPNQQIPSPERRHNTDWDVSMEEDKLANPIEQAKE